MACCALAAFLVSQLLVALDWLRERAGLAPARAAHSASAAWRLGDAPLAMRARSVAPALAPRRLALAVGGGALAFAVTYSVLGVGGAQRAHAFRIPYLCTSDPSLGLD